jgi:fluoride exporter
VDGQIDRTTLGRVFRAPWDVLGAVALGGVIGASARYGISLTWPASATGFPWAIFVVNASGCALIGALMVVIVERGTAHRLARPFFGTGVLGGYTTFSTYAVDVARLTEAGAARTALAYLVLTPITALLAAWVGTVLTRLAIRKRPAVSMALRRHESR